MHIFKKLVTTEYHLQSSAGAEPGQNGCSGQNGGFGQDGGSGRDAGCGQDAGLVRFVFLTDFHDACTPYEAEQLLRAVRACDPDFVLCGGDMITAWMAPEIRRTARVMVRLAEIYPVFYAPGNHEGRSRWMLGGEDEIVDIVNRKYRARTGSRPEFEAKLREQRRRYRWYRRTLEAAGVRFLENEEVHLTVRGRRIRICGLDIPRGYYKRFRGPLLPVSVIREAFGDPVSSEYTILLAHTPRMLQTYQQWGADLTLCGHYHGGVIRLGGHRGLISPDLRLFPDNAYGCFSYRCFSSGCFSSGRKHVIVSSGCGEHTIPFRIANPREVVSVRLTLNSCEDV